MGYFTFVIVTRICLCNNNELMIAENLGTSPFWMERGIIFSRDWDWDWELNERLFGRVLL